MTQPLPHRCQSLPLQYSLSNASCPQVSQTAFTCSSSSYYLYSVCLSSWSQPRPASYQAHSWLSHPNSCSAASAHLVLYQPTPHHSQRLTEHYQTYGPTMQWYFDSVYLLAKYRGTPAIATYFPSLLLPTVHAFLATHLWLLFALGLTDRFPFLSLCS